MVTYIYTPSTPELEAGGSNIQGYPQLRSELEASLGNKTLFTGKIAGVFNAFLNLVPKTNVSLFISAPGRMSSLGEYQYP